MDTKGVLIGGGVYIKMGNYQRQGAWTASLADGSVLARGEARDIHHAIAQFRLGVTSSNPVKRSEVVR